MALSVRGLRTGGSNPQGFYFTLKGVDALRRQLEELAEVPLEDELTEAVENALNDYVLEPAREIVPYDTGRLHDSGFVSVTNERGRIRAIVGFDTEYAIYVHENPDVFHKPPTRWKFLEEPLFANKARVVAAIGYAMRRAIAEITRGA